MKWVVALLLACGPTSTSGGTKKPVVELVNAAEIEAMLQGRVTNGGLYFADADCARQFAVGGDVAPPLFSAFAQCLAGLKLQRSGRTDALPDVSVYWYVPGIEVEARIVRDVAGLRLSWIGYAQRRTTDEPVTITKAAFEGLRTSGDANGPLDPVDAEKLVLNPVPKSRAEYAWLKVCLDETGAVSSVTALASTTSRAHKAFRAAAAKWTFKPYKLAGQPVPACAVVRPAYPADGAPAVEMLPLPLPPPREGRADPIVLVGASKELKKPIVDKGMILPDDATRAAIKRDGTNALGFFRVCFDENGNVDWVVTLRSTGYASYDRKIIEEMKQEKYAPLVVDGQAVSVCSTAAYQYGYR